MVYRAFGLDIASDVPLNGMVPGSVARAPDVHVGFGRLDDLTSGELFYRSQGADGVPILRVYQLADGAFRFVYSDGVAFLVNSSGSDVRMQWPERFTVEDAATYLLGPIFGFLLRLRGVVSLHASGVLIGETAIALLGQAGAGKSTTAAAFAQRGYDVITDDVFALADCGVRFFVEPGYATLRLWPESVAALWGSPDALPPITPNWDKRYLDLRNGRFRFATTRVPVSAIYVLGERRHERAPAIGPEGEPFMALLPNTYCNYLLDRRARAHEFDVLSRLVNSTIVRRVVPHADASRLPELCSMIEEDCRSRVPSSIS
jgi:hypothetical protein